MKYSKLMFAPILALMAGCSYAPPAQVLPLNSPANAETEIRNTRHRDVIGGYEHRDVVRPQPWRRSNEEQSPGQGGNQ